ncbi:MAG: hypothetical protein QXJ02_01210 [Candidatus Bathyarchaeia archaeon]
MTKLDFEKMILQAIDEGLSTLGDSSKEAIYFYLDKNFKLKKEQIPNKIEDFEVALKNIFGAGANYLEILIMKQLYEKFNGNLPLKKPDKLAFSDYVAAVKQAVKERLKEKEFFVECETINVSL